MNERKRRLPLYDAPFALASGVEAPVASWSMDGRLTGVLGKEGVGVVSSADADTFRVSSTILSNAQSIGWLSKRMNKVASQTRMFEFLLALLGFRRFSS